MNRIKVFVVDDHNLVKEGLIAMLTEFGEDIQFLGQAGNGLELLHELRKLETLPHIILMDINMPVMNGIETTKQIKKENPDIEIIALTMMNQSSHIKLMLEAGAKGYILKDGNKKELELAIRTVATGETFFSPSVSKEVMDRMIAVKKKSMLQKHSLTKRELEVLGLIVEDLSNQQIADKLNISTKTIDTHKQNILAKTGTQSIAGLVVYAIKTKIVELPD